MVYCFKLHEGSGLCLIFRFVFCIVQFEIAIKSIKYTSRDMLSSDQYIGTCKLSDVGVPGGVIYNLDRELFIQGPFHIWTIWTDKIELYQH